MIVYDSGSPEWWRDRLLKALQDRIGKVDTLEAYYRGDHPLPKPPKSLLDSSYGEAISAYRTLAQMGISNWVKLVADAPSERLAVVGFRFGEAQAGDQDAWAIWQQNQLDADSALVHDNALQTGQSFAMVWSDSDGEPVITPEHSSQVIVAYEPGSRRRRAAALKCWTEDDGTWRANLYLPHDVYRWQTSNKPKQAVRAQWSLIDEFLNPLGVVPIVEFRANSTLRPATYGGGCGEFEPVLSIQDRINKTIFDRLVTAEFQAFRQRVLIGWDPPTDSNGNVDKSSVFKASVSRIWTIDQEPDSVRIDELAQADFTPFIKAVESDITAMAAQTKTPPQETTSRGA